MGRVVEYLEEYRVPFGDTDAAGVVFYPNYYRWFDRMTHELFRHIGQPLSTFAELSQAPVIVEARCSFTAATRYDDVVWLAARVSDVGRRSFRIDHEVSRAGDGVAVGYEKRVWVRITDRVATPISLPLEVADALRCWAAD